MREISQALPTSTYLLIGSTDRPRHSSHTAPHPSSFLLARSFLDLDIQVLGQQVSHTFAHVPVSCFMKAYFCFVSLESVSSPRTLYLYLSHRPILYSPNRIYGVSGSAVSLTVRVFPSLGLPGLCSGGFPSPVSCTPHTNSNDR